MVVAAAGVRIVMVLACCCVICQDSRLSPALIAVGNEAYMARQDTFHNYGLLEVREILHSFDQILLNFIQYHLTLLLIQYV